MNFSERHLIVSGATIAASLTCAIWLATRPNAPAAVLSAHEMKHTRPAIDGAVNPELIPDDVAYSLVLRMLTPEPGPVGERRTRALVRFMYVESKYGSPALPPPGPEEVDAIMRMLASYAPRLEALDPALRATAAHKENDFASADAAAAAKAQRAVIVADFRAQLEQDLGPVSASRIHRFVTESAKKRMKIVY